MLTKQEKKKLRKKILVDKKFQSSFVLSMIISLLIIIVLLSFLIIYSTSNKITGSAYSKILELKNTKQIIMPTVIKISLLIIILVGGFASYNLLKYSHKIVGPLVRFKKSLKLVGNGDLTTFIKFRRNDKLKELGDIFTSSIKKLNKTLKLAKNDYSKISEILLNKNIKKLTQKEIEELKKNIKHLGEILEKIKT